MTKKSNLLVNVAFGTAAALCLAGHGLYLKNTIAQGMLPHDTTDSAWTCEQQIKAGQACSLEGTANLLMIKEMSEDRLSLLSKLTAITFFLMLASFPYLRPQKKQSATPDKTPTPPQP